MGLNPKAVVCVLVVSCLFGSLPLFAAKSHSLGNSNDGVGPATLCPDSTSTPFFAQLDGTQSPPAGCNAANGDPNVPNPPAVYPNRAVVLKDAANSFTVTITPALWARGDGNVSPISNSKYTVLQVEFTGQAGMTLQSLVIGVRLNNPTYVACDPSFNAMPFCTSTPVLDPSDFEPGNVWEPNAIPLADYTTTRWDFCPQADPCLFASNSGNTITLAVDGFPSEFQSIDIYPRSNALTPASFTPANFLAIVKDATNKTLTAGGLVLKTAAPATNDLSTNAKTIPAVPFTDFIDTSAVNPQEIISGANAGGETVNQSDPAPTDPTQKNPGVGCSSTWSAGASRVFRSAWYTFTPAVSGSYTITTAGSRYDTGIYVFTGSMAIACNDDAISPLFFAVHSSDVTFNATATVPYSIMVSEAPPPTGKDAGGNVAAMPLADDATLMFSLAQTGPTPYVDIVQPAAALPGTVIPQLTLLGAGFVSGASVSFNGTPLAPATVSSNKVVVNNVTVPASGVAAPVMVVNPSSSPKVGLSNLAYLPVTNSTSVLQTVDLDTSVTNGGGYPLLADFNHDGFLDIAIPGVGGSSIALLVGNGDGTFLFDRDYDTGAQPIAAAVADFNGDGRLDLATANEFDGTVSVLLGRDSGFDGTGNGTGIFGSPINYVTGSIANWVLTGDFNQDGNVDLAVVNFGANNISILLGKGDGTHQPAVNYATGSSPTSAVAGDFDGDGKLDLVSADEGASTLSFLHGNGDGTFQPPVPFPTGANPVVVVAGDFNGDGKLDLASANEGAGNVSVLSGNGNGTFQTHADVAVGTLTKSLAVGDVNGDGKLDLVVARVSAQSVNVLLGNGNGTFKSPVTFPSGTSLGLLALGDLNNDGMLDVVTGTSAGFSSLLQVPVAAVTLNPVKLTFPIKVVGKTSVPQSVTLQNTGNGTLTISNIAITGTNAADFSIQSKTCGSSVAPGTKCTFTVVFTPTGKDTRTAAVTITDNAANSPQSVPLTGKGTFVSLSPNTWNFGSQKVGTQSATKTFTVTNTNTVTLNISSIKLGGTNPGDFKITGKTCGSTLGAKASCKVTAAFKPTATGARTANINISDDGGASPQPIMLSGTGT